MKMTNRCCGAHQKTTEAKRWFIYKGQRTWRIHFVWMALLRSRKHSNIINCKQKRYTRVINRCWICDWSKYTGISYQARKAGSSFPIGEWPTIVYINVWHKFIFNASLDQAERKLENCILKINNQIGLSWFFNVWSPDYAFIIQHHKSQTARMRKDAD